MKKQPKVWRYMPKNNKSANVNIIYMLMPSLIGIILCTACLIGLTFAWFTVSIDVAPQKFTAANFDFDVSVTYNSEDIAQNADSTFSLKAGTSYYITLNPIGTANSGYCIIQNGNRNYYSDTIKKGQPFSFTLIPGSDSDFAFIPVWGLFKGTVDITDSSIFNTPSEEGTAEFNKETEEYNFNEQPNSKLASNDPIPTQSASDESATENVTKNETSYESVLDETTSQ